MKIYFGKIISVGFFLIATSFTFAQQSNDSLKIINLLNLAKEEQVNYQYEKAFLLLKEAISKSETSKLNSLYFRSNTELANFYIMTNQLDEAQAVFLTSKPEASYPSDWICEFYHRKAFYFNQTQSLDSALIYSQKALKIAESHNLIDSKGTIYNELANIYEKKDSLQKSLIYYQKALKVFKNDLRYYSNIYLNKARVYNSLKLIDSSIYHLKRNLELIDTTEWSTIKKPIYFYLHKNYLEKKDSLNAFKNKILEQQELIKSNSFENDKLFQELKNTYNLQEKDLLLSKKEVEKTLLNYIIITLTLLILTFFVFSIITKRKNKKLSKLLAENNFLIEEANHRIKNNLQLIVSLVARETNKKTDKEIDVLTNIATKIESIATLHQQLYINEEKDKIELATYLNEIIENIKPLLEAYNIKITSEIEKTFLNINTSLYLGLVLNELIINSIKHAFNNDTNDNLIRINISKEKNGITLDYYDNGKGVKPNTELRLLTLLSKQLKSKHIITNGNPFTFKLNISI